MDIKKAKVKKKGPKLVDADDSGQEEVQETGSQVSTATEVVDQPEEAEETESPVIAEEDKKGWVTFTCMEEIDPSPVVGSFSFTRDLGIPKLEARKNYSMPLHVALHLIDK